MAKEREILCSDPLGGEDLVGARVTRL